MHHVPKDIGWIEVICGSMFSGKTEELIRRVRRAQYARQKTQLFKPALDDRYGTATIASHDQRSLECVPLEKISDIYEHLDADTEVVGLDEAQFAKLLEDLNVFVTEQDAEGGGAQGVVTPMYDPEVTE